MILCQVCGGSNPDDAEYCRHCQSKLLVVSGPHAYEEQEQFDSQPEEQLSFDEHLLERISILEEVLQRTTETVRRTLGSLYQLEQKILINQTGVTTLRDLLERKRVIAREEWSDLWESRMDTRLMALEKRDRFSDVKERIFAHYRGDHDDEFRRFLDEADTALLAFDLDRAVRSLEHAHQLDPANHELAFFLGEAFLNEGNVPIALEYFRRVLLVQPKHFESLVYSGVMRHLRGESTAAEMLLKTAVAAYPDAFLPAFSLGAIYASQGMLERATAFLSLAVGADPIPQAHYLIGACSWEMGRSNDAVRHLKEAVRLDPGSVEAHSLLGLAYLDRGWNRKASSSLQEAQRLGPKNLGHGEIVGLLSIDEHPQLQEILQETEQQFDLEHAQEVLGIYRDALAQQPDDVHLLIAYAAACLEIGRLHEIDAVLDKVFDLAQDEESRAVAYVVQMEALRAADRYRESISLGIELLREEDGEFLHCLAGLETAYNLAEIEQDLDEAVELGRRALEAAPQRAEHAALAVLGWVQYKRRDFDDAVDCLRRATQLRPAPRTWTQLGMALLDRGDLKDAREALLEARRADEGAQLDDQVLACLKDGTRWLQSGTVR